MIPRSTVLATQNHVSSTLPLIVLSAFLLWMVGCGEPGPRALLKGERLIKEGQFQKSLEALQTAVRLLPNNAQAWNHLGLAYHGLNQPQQALNAYHRALTFDHKLASARFNVGCLLLEQNNASSAVEQLTSFTLLEPGVVDGWLKLGSAQAKSDQLDAAERSFKTALELDPDNAAALNGLGLIQVKRQRPLDGLQYFKKALAAEEDYPPALLNMAIVTHDQLKNKPTSLQLYKQFLDIKPRPDNWESVATLAQVLEQELNPVPSRSTSSAKLASAPPKPGLDQAVQILPNNQAKTTNERPRPNMTATQKVNVKRSLSPTSITASPPAMMVASSDPKDGTKTKEPAEASRPPSKKETGPTFLVTNQPPPPPIQVTEPGTTAEATDPHPTESSPTKVVSSTVALPPKDERETPSTVPRKQALQVPKELAVDPGDLSMVAAPGGSQTQKPLAPARNLTSQRPSRPLATAFANDYAGAGYRYLRPTAPLPGDREAAEPHFKEGLKWHRAGRQAIAVEHYQEAARLDPAFFEAYFNQGVAASEVASWKHALAAYEMAMAINPDSVRAHYNFCTTLKKANYPEDSVTELKLLLGKHPDHAKAHLALANMYAQQFNQPAKARPHYQKVLELDPFNSEAPKIRYWLSTNR